MYYPERRFDSDWLLLLLAVVALVAVIMYNPAPPHLIAEGLTHIFVVDAVHGDINATIVIYFPTDAVVTLADYNVSKTFSKGMHEISIASDGPIRICAKGTDFNECGLIYPVTP